MYLILLIRKIAIPLKTAFVLPLGGKNATEVINNLKEFSYMVRKVLSKKITMKFLPKLIFVKDESFDYAEKIENLIKQTNRQEKIW